MSPADLSATVVVLTLACGVAAMVIVRAVVGGRERRRHAALLSTLGAPLTDAGIESSSPRDVATVEGTLASNDEGARIVSFHPFGSSYLEEPNLYAVTQARGSFAILVDGRRRVVLEEPFQVLIGGVETEHARPARHGSLYGAPDLAARPDLQGRTGQFRVLLPNTRVRAKGVLVPAPDDDADYRGRTRVLRLSPSEEGRGTPVLLAAAMPPRGLRATKRPALLTVLGVTVAAAAVSGAGTILAIRSTAPTPAATTALVAAPPPCRADVLDALSRNWFDVATRAAATCGDARAKATAAFASGAFREASEEFAVASDREPDAEPSLSEAEAHLFAHEPARAASVVRRMVARFYQGPDTDEKRTLGCIVQQLDVLAKRGLEHPYKRPYERDYCSGVHVGTSVVRRYAFELEDEGGSAGGFEHYAPSYDAVGNPFGVIAPRRRLRARPVGIENRLLTEYVVGQKPLNHPRPDGEPPRRGAFGNLTAIWDEGGGDRFAQLSAFAAELALFYATHAAVDRTPPLFAVLDRVAERLEASPYRAFFERAPIEGDDATTRAWVQETQAAERVYLTHVMAVAAGAAHFAGDDARLRRYAAVGDAHASGAVAQLARMADPRVPWEKPIEDAHWADHAAVFDAAMGGDAAAVVAVLDAQHVTGAETLPRVAKRLDKNRDVLATWFRSRFPAPCLTCGASDFAGHLADRRVVAGLLGESRDDVADRALRDFVQALTDPVVAYEVDALERFFAP